MRLPPFTEILDNLGRSGRIENVASRLNGPGATSTALLERQPAVLAAECLRIPSFNFGDPTP